MDLRKGLQHTMKKNLEDICFDIEPNTMNYHATSPEIVMTSSFYFDSFKSYSRASHDELNSFMYTRGSNPTTLQLEHKLAQLEGGERCKVFASGMGAISATLFHLLSSNDHVVILNTVYSTTLSFLKFLEQYGVSYTLVNSLDAHAIERAIQKNTRVIYTESPSTQKFEIVDLEVISKIAKNHHIISVIDNTWATPLFQRPLESGFDLVVASCSKYIGGHSDIVCGALIGSKDLVEAIEKSGFVYLGATCSPFTSFLALRGLRTLPLRMKKHSENVVYLIDALKKDPRIQTIYHPYSQQHKLAKQTLEGYGSLLAITLVDKDIEKLECFVNALNEYLLGVSWGGYESMVLPVYKGDNQDSIEKRGLDITHTRLFIGLKNPQILVDDVIQALDCAYGK